MNKENEEIQYQEELSIAEEVFLDEMEAEQNEIRQLEAERDDYKNKYLFALADVDNIKKRFNVERPLLVERGEQNVLKEILTVVDDFERALIHNIKVTDPDILKEGFDRLYEKFMNVLSSLKVEKIYANGDKFDVDKHEAITTLPVPEGEENLENVIADTTRVGYTYKDKVLRHSQVAVYKNL